MKLKKVLKVISVIVALAAVGAAIYLAIQKLTAKKEPEYFDDNDFFECDNELEIVEAKKEEPAVEEASAEEKPKKKTAAKKSTAKKPAKKDAE